MLGIYLRRNFSLVISVGSTASIRIRLIGAMSSGWRLGVPSLLRFHQRWSSRSSSRQQLMRALARWRVRWFTQSQSPLGLSISWRGLTTILPPRLRPMRINADADGGGGGAALQRLHRCRQAQAALRQRPSPLVHRCIHVWGHSLPRPATWRLRRRRDALARCSSRATVMTRQLLRLPRGPLQPFLRGCRWGGAPMRRLGPACP